MKQIFERLDLLRGRSADIIRDEGVPVESPDLIQRLQEDEEILGWTTEIRELVEKIQSHGCLCKGVEQGLVDFPCLLGGEIVFLCWRYGEESVSHWHRMEDGFPGRKPLLDADDGRGGNLTH